MKKYLKYVIPTLIGTLLTGAVSFTIFAFNVHETVVETVPKLEIKIEAIGDTIRKINNRPAQIERKVFLIEQDLDAIKKTQEGLRKAIDSNAKQQQEDTKEILKLLIQIKNK